MITLQIFLNLLFSILIKILIDFNNLFFPSNLGYPGQDHDSNEISFSGSFWSISPTILYWSMYARSCVYNYIVDRSDGLETH